MAEICPAVLEATPEAYEEAIKRIEPFAKRIQIDLTDSKFAPSPTIKPADAWWPAGIKADIHLMYKDPTSAISDLLDKKPHLIIVHAEAGCNFEEVAKLCHAHGIKAGLCLLKETNPDTFKPQLEYADHVLLFEGSLGKYGGQADLSELSKVTDLKTSYPNLEIGWDGGVNDQNVSELVAGGVDVLTVGGFIQKSDNPQKAFTILQRIADETGTT